LRRHLYCREDTIGIRNPTYKEDSYDGITDNRASQSYENLGNKMSLKYTPTKKRISVFIFWFNALYTNMFYPN